MAFSIVATTSDPGTNDSAVSSAINTTGANLIVVIASWFPGGGSPTVTVTDNKGNTYASRTAYDSEVTRRVQLWYVQGSPTVGSGHIVTVAGTESYAAVSVLAASGAAASAFDLDSGANEDGSSDIEPGSITPSEANCLVITGIAENASGATLSVNGGFTADSTPAASGVNTGGGIAYLIQTSAAAANPTWSWSGSFGGAATIASFKASAGGGGTPPYASIPKQMGVRRIA